MQLEKKLEESNNEAVELTERIRVARHERSQALAEREDIIQKHYFEEQKRKKAEHEVNKFIIIVVMLCSWCVWVLAVKNVLLQHLNNCVLKCISILPL